MEFKGQLKGISRDWLSGKFQIIFETDLDVTRHIDSIRDIVLTITAKKYSKKRSMEANAYYWKLASELADKLGVSKPYLHNLLLRRYGQPEIIDGKLVYLVLPDSDSGTRKADEAETYHIRPTAQVKEGSDGLMYRTYIMLRGSSTYDTAEMSRLIDGLISECKEQGIETLPPEELQRMMKAYEQKWRKRHEKAA